MGALKITCPAFDRATEYAGAWAIEPRAAAALWQVAHDQDLAQHLAAAPARPVESSMEFVAAEGGKRVALLKAQGLLMKQQSSLGSSTSTVQLRRDVRQAVADPSVAAILLAIDSPGGTVDGTEALANDLKDARKAKPVYAQIEGQGSSAAYWLAAMADKVYASDRTTRTGSIGTYRVVQDLSAAAEREGVKVHVFATGELKGAGTPGTALTDPHKANYQQQVEALQAVFDDAVLQGRRLTPDQLAAVRTGGEFLAEEAQRLGLVDGVQSLDATLRQLTGQAPAHPGGGRPSSGQSPHAGKGVPAMTFEQYCQDRGIVAAGLSPEQLSRVRTDYEAAQAAAVPPVAHPVKPAAALANAGGASDADALQARNLLLAQIRDVCAEFGNPRVHLDGETASVEVHALKKNWNLNETRQACQLAQVRDGRPALAGVPPVGPLDRYQGGTGPGFVFPRGPSPAAIEASLCLSAGIAEARVGRWFSPDVMNRAVAADARGLRLGHLLYASCQAAGVHVRPGGVDDAVIMKAIRADREVLARQWNAEKDRVYGPDGETLAAAGPTTLSLSGILSNVANKAALNSYELQAAVWRRFCAVRTHNDFKTVTRYRIDSTGAIKKVGADGKLKHVGLTETGFTNRLDTFGGMITLNRQMLVNDDLQMFLQIPMFLGQMTAIRIEELFFVTLLANAGSFYSSGNGNLVPGAGGVMTAANGIAAITLAETKFSNMVDKGNKPILIPPTTMLLGTVNYVPARNIYEGRMKITGANQTEVSNNEHAGKYEPVKSPYVNNTAIKDQDGAAISGQSSTVWFLFADPAARASYGAAFLNGNQAPTIASEATEFGTLGMSWEIFHDFGIGQEDPNGSVMVAGA